MRPLDPSTFSNPRMREVAQWHLLILRTDLLSARTGFGLDDVWALIKSGSYKHAEALLFEHARRLRGINAGGNRGERDSVSDDQSSSGEGNRRSEGKCASCSRDLNLDQANPESAETTVSVGREGL